MQYKTWNIWKLHVWSLGFHSIQFIFPQPWSLKNTPCSYHIVCSEAQQHYIHIGMHWLCKCRIGKVHYFSTGGGYGQRCILVAFRYHYFTMRIHFSFKKSLVNLILIWTKFFFRFSLKCVKTFFRPICLRIIHFYLFTIFSAVNHWFPFRTDFRHSCHIKRAFIIPAVGKKKW